MQGKRNKTIISRITENRNFGLLLGLAVLLIIAAIVTPSMYDGNLNSIVIIGFLMMSVCCMQFRVRLLLQ